MKKLLANLTDGIDDPIPSGFTSWIKKGLFQVIIIYEDSSYKVFNEQFPETYFFSIKGKSYLLVPKAVIKGKRPLILYYYNNPYPLVLEFEHSQISADDLRTGDQLDKLKEEQKTMLANVPIDAKMLNLAFTTQVMKGLYEKRGLTVKAIIIILVVIAVIILVFLQVFGVVDVWGFITGAKFQK